MDISASDVENVTFATSKKGYDPDQVDRFLDNVAATLRGLEDQLRQARARIGELETQAAEASETEEMMRRTLLVAQRASDEALAEAQARARELIANAESQARELEAAAAARVSELESRMQRQRQAFEADIEALRRFHTDFRQALQQMISEHADVLHKTGRLAEQLPELPSSKDERPVSTATQRPASLAPEPRIAQGSQPPSGESGTGTVGESITAGVSGGGESGSGAAVSAAEFEGERMVPPRRSGIEPQRVVAPPPPSPDRPPEPQNEPERSAPAPPVPPPGVAPSSRPATAPD